MQLSASQLMELGNSISDKLVNQGAILHNKLVISMDEKSFKKIDEDLYYRNNGKAELFVPSDSNITVTFPYVDVIIQKSTITPESRT